MFVNVIGEREPRWIPRDLDASVNDILTTGTITTDKITSGYIDASRIRATTLIAQHAAGDLVEIKSGGPAMTVRSICEDCGDVIVQWFNFDDEAGFTLETDSFPADCLVPADA